MKKPPLIFRCLLLLALAASNVYADPKVVEEALAKALPELKPDSVQEAPMPGLYEVTVGPNVFYVSRDGKYLLQGKLIDLAARADLTEARVAAARLASIGKIGHDNMIVFAPKEPKYTVSVFTDIDCGYCRKLHSQIEDYRKEGIAVHYLFFPRAGEGSESYKKAVSVWCAKDRNTALTRAKKGEAIEDKQCDSPVDKHMALARALGANGTPMIVTDGGEILPGYVPPKQLAELLAQEKARPRP
jgi:thiol:disulfide interchange protein DsbC